MNKTIEEEVEERIPSIETCRKEKQFASVVLSIIMRNENNALKMHNRCKGLTIET